MIYHKFSLKIKYFTIYIVSIYIYIVLNYNDGESMFSVFES